MDFVVERAPEPTVVSDDGSTHETRAQLRGSPCTAATYDKIVKLAQ